MNGSVITKNNIEISFSSLLKIININDTVLIKQEKQFVSGIVNKINNDEYIITVNEKKITTTRNHIFKYNKINSLGEIFNI